MLSNAEKQRRFRQRHLEGDGTKIRLQCNLEIGAKCNLERLASHFGLSQTDMLEKLIGEKVDELMVGMDSEEIKHFLKRVC